MMGTKARNVAPLSNISLELFPQDHLYRHLDQTLDLSFVREFCGIGPEKCTLQT